MSSGLPLQTVDGFVQGEKEANLIFGPASNLSREEFDCAALVVSISQLNIKPGVPELVSYRKRMSWLLNGIV